MGLLIIDGHEIEADQNRTVLEAAVELGIEIPTLCTYRGLTPYGACRVCVVETIWKGKSRLHPACTYPAWEGEVRTDSEMVRKARRFVVELMLAEAPDAVEIRDLAAKLGIEGTPFRTPEDRSDNRCIMCGLCVRMCRDVVGAGALAFRGRGDNRAIATPYAEKSEVCIACGACEFICPTDAIDLGLITDLTPRPLASEFDTRLVSRSSIYLPFPQAVPAVPVLDDEHCLKKTLGTCGVCEKVCGPDAIDYEMEEREEPLQVGTVVVATGFDEFDPCLKPELGYASYENVITGLEMERICSASGPTTGEIVIAGKKPKDVVFIQCVGSRDETVGNEYCSRVCCMFTAKQAHLVKEKIPDANVTVFYMDIRAFGKGFEEFYDRVRKEGVIYRRGSVSEIYKRKDRLVVRGEDTLEGEPLDVEADLVVLAAGLVPREGTGRLANALKLCCSQDNFLMEAHPKLRPVDTASEGIYLAGCCQGPKDIPDTVAQAKAAASSAIIPMSKGTVTVEALSCSIDEDLCAGCRICISVCPYGALTLDEEKDVSSCNEALCKGCGTCAAACPSGTISMAHFSSDQLLAQVVALMGGSDGGR
jgi:heterodisulfide reductase subunit A